MLSKSTPWCYRYLIFLTSTIIICAPLLCLNKLKKTNIVSRGCSVLIIQSDLISTWQTNLTKQIHSPRRLEWTCHRIGNESEAYVSGTRIFSADNGECKDLLSAFLTKHVTALSELEESALFQTCYFTPELGKWTAEVMQEHDKIGEQTYMLLDEGPELSRCQSYSQIDIVTQPCPQSDTNHLGYLRVY